MQARYNDEVVDALAKEFGLNRMQIPRLQKVVMNMGLGDAVQNSKLIEGAVKELSAITGQKAALLIPEIKNAVARYPWANEYTLFPGPNSNTFPAWIGVQVPELDVDMPFRAIGSGYAD